MSVPALPSTAERIPDGVFGLEYTTDGTKAYRFFALEVDRGTMPIERNDARQTSYLGKLAAYRTLVAEQLYRSHWGIPNLLVLTVMLDEGRMNETIRKFGERGGGQQFLFKTVEPKSLVVPAPNVLLEPWQRAELPLLRIDE